MNDIGDVIGGANRFVEGGMEIAHQLVQPLIEARYARLSRILYSLQQCTTEELQKYLSVEYVGPGVVVDLTEYAYREDPYPFPDHGRETSTRTIVDAHWGDNGESKLYVTAHREKLREGEIIQTADYRCDVPFLDNTLRLGSVIHAAKIARSMQRRQAKRHS